MARGSDMGRTQIVVALIGVSGVISAALIANWDKLARGDAPQSVVAKQEGTVPTVNESRAQQADPVTDVSNSQGNALETRTAARATLRDLGNKIDAMVPGRAADLVKISQYLGLPSDNVPLEDQAIGIVAKLQEMAAADPASLNSFVETMQSRGVDLRT